MPTLRVTWHRAADLRRDIEQQLSRGGLFVTVEPPAELPARVAVELVAGAPGPHRFEAAVLSSAPGVGLCVSVPPEVVAALRAAADALPPGEAATEHRWVGGDVIPVMDEPAETPPPAPAPSPTSAPMSSVDLAQRWDSLSPAEKLRYAQHGDRDARGAAMRDVNRGLRLHVLKNPQLSIDELAVIARDPQSAQDHLEYIASRSEWVGRSTIAEALARNPRTPRDLAPKLLQYVSAEALRQMAKGVGAPPHVVQAARKKVLG